MEKHILRAFAQNYNPNSTQGNMLGLIRVVLRKERVTKEGLSSLSIQFSIGKESVKIAVGLSVPIDLWDPVKEEVKGKTVFAHDANLIISDKLAEIHAIRLQFFAKKIPLDKEKFIKAYKSKGIYVDFYHYYQVCKNKKYNDDVISYNTMVMYDDTYTKMRAFRDKLSFSELSVRIIEDFRSYLVTKHNLSVNSIYKHLKNIRAVMNEAKKEYIDFEYPFDKIVMEKVNPPRIFLRVHELKILRDLYRTNYFIDSGRPTTHCSLEIFLFCCYTSVRISDAKQLTRSNIKGDEIHFVEQKKSKKKKLLIIPLLDFAKEIIKGRQDKLFFDLSRNAINHHLKVVQEAAALDKNLSCHVARHSFAGIFYKATKDILALQKILGHEKIETTMIYAHMAQEDIIEGANKMNDLLK